MKGIDRMSKELEFQGKAVGVFGGNVVLSMRAYFSTYYIWASKHFLGLATNIEDTDQDGPVFNLHHRVYIMNSILSAAAFLEAAINEVYHNVHSDKPNVYKENLAPEVIENLSAHWANTDLSNNFRSTLNKYQNALRCANKKEFSKNENLYKDVQLVIDLRHFLTHYKPMDLNVNSKHELDDKLREKFLPNKLMDGSGNNFFPDHALGKGSAEWSLLSVKNFADEFFEKIDIKPNYQKVDMDKLGDKESSAQSTT